MLKQPSMTLHDNPVADDKKINMTPPANEQDDNFQAQREQMHRQMLSAVSHDLKTPIASVIGSLEIYTRMGAQLSPEKRDMLIQTALTEAYRLDNFLTNILDMGKLEGDLVPLRIMESNVRDVIEHTVSNLSARLVKAKVSINGPANVHAHTDAALLGRVLTLLLDNAVRHTKPSPIITINYKAEGDIVRIDVMDDGPGIPVDKREEIFSKYTRLKRGDMQNAGTGLGLAIARLIAKKLNGTISASSSPSGGACFTLEIARK